MELFLYILFNVMFEVHYQLTSLYLPKSFQNQFLSLVSCTENDPNMSSSATGNDVLTNNLQFDPFIRIFNWDIYT